MKVLEKKEKAPLTGDAKIKAATRALVRAGYDSKAAVQAVLAVECAGKKFDRARMAYVTNLARRTASEALAARARAKAAIEAAQTSSATSKLRITEVMVHGAEAADRHHHAVLGADY